MSVSPVPPHLCSHSPCMPSITSHHAPLCVYVCVSHHIFRNPIIQRSSEQPSPTALLTTAKCQHQAANTGINKKSSDPMTSLDLLSPSLLSHIWRKSLRGRVVRKGRAGSLSSVYRIWKLYLATAPIFTFKVRPLEKSQLAFFHFHKWTISDIYNHCQQPPSAAYYHDPLPHLLFLWHLNWLTVFATY